jgi:hypothetical protein
VPDDVEAQLEQRYAMLVARSEDSRRGRALKELAGLAILLALAAVNALWFDAAGSDYLSWYLDHGAIIALVFGVVSVAVELDRQPALIAADPIGFVQGVVAIFLELSTSFWAMFGGTRSDRALADAGLEAVQSTRRVALFDLLFAALFLGVFALGMIGWALVVAPLQYWVNIVAGTPARTALASSTTVWRVQVDPVRVGYVYGPKDLDEITDRDEARKLAEGRASGRVTETTFAARPVALTNAIAAALLFAASQLV